MATVMPAEAAPQARTPTDWQAPDMQRRIAARYRAERNFRFLGLAALLLAGAFLVFLLGTIVRDGWSGFQRTEVQVSVTFDPAVLGVDPAAARGPDGLTILRRADWVGLMLVSANRLGPAADAVSEAAWVRLRDAVIADPALLGQTRTIWVPATSNIDLLAKGKFDLDAPAESRGVSDEEVSDWRLLAQKGLIRTGLNTTFLMEADSTDPELAGIRGAAIGSLLTLLITISIASISRNMPPRTAGPISSRFRSTIWPPCLPSSSACSAWRCS